MTANFPAGELDHEQVKSEHEFRLESPWSEEHECVPLKQRLKMLRAKAVSNSREEVLISAISPIDDVVKKEDDLCNSMVLEKVTMQDFDSDQDGNEGRRASTSCELNGTSHIIQNHYVTNYQHPSSDDYNKNSEAFNDDFDHVTLRERQRMLLSRKRAGSSGPAMEHNVSVGIGSKKRNISGAIREKDIFDGTANISSDSHMLNDSTCQDQETTLTKPQSYKKVNPCSSVKNTVHKKPLLPNVKIEPLDDNLEIPSKNAINIPCARNKIISVKSENVNSSEVFEDIIDHMMLGDRMRLLASRKSPKNNLFENLKTFVPPGNNHNKRIPLESSKPVLMKLPRKRKKTVTDSIETALEEDAPGLLQVLIKKGVLVDEIKLYGENEGDEALDESLVEESFSELEDVIEKLFSQRQSSIKLAAMRCARGEKASYCLSCLISLVEQARYLRGRKWPVEWGWCRDLQSFIFVFEKHNRIVLERPEYGYATYFFELVDALPVNWQIKRLVTAMKLTSCSRITLIENRPLTVGDDVTEGEARVLMEYGWIPNSGLGTMLNYCDRVVHDRKSEFESDSSEWRSKIGKMLTDGFNGGIIVPNDIPKKVMEYGLGQSQSQSPEIKLEY